MCQRVLSLQAQTAEQQQQRSAKKVTELQWELQHAWQEFQQADKNQKASLDTARERVAKLESDRQQASEDAARLEQRAAKAEVGSAQHA